MSRAHGQGWNRPGAGQGRRRSTRRLLLVFGSLASLAQSVLVVGLVQQSSTGILAVARAQPPGRFLRANRRLAHQLLKRGLRQMAAGRYSEAIDNLDRSHRLHPSEQALSLLAECYERVRKPEMARQTYARLPQQARERLARQFTARGLERMSRGRYAAAISDFKRSIILRSNAKLQFLLGQCHELAGQLELARKIYEELLSKKKPGLQRSAIKQRLEALRRREAEAQQRDKRPAPTSRPSAPELPEPEVSGKSEPSEIKQREDAIFGEGDEGQEEGEGDLPRKESKLLDLGSDKLQIGGLLYLRLNFSFVASDSVSDQSISMPNITDIYLDARPSDRLRAFIRGRMKWDPTYDESAGLSAAMGGSRLRVVLDELWLKFDIVRVAFVTIGQQKVRWGAARFWNPVDPVNLTQRALLQPFDERNGVPLLKVHLPIESLGWNLYLGGMLDSWDSLDRGGVAARAEIVFSTVEVGLSGAYRPHAGDADPAPGKSCVSNADCGAGELCLGQCVGLGGAGVSDEGKLGLDLSAGIWHLDLTAEAGLRIDDRFKNRVSVQVAAGLQVEATVFDNDKLYLGGEYFYNQDGTHEVNPVEILVGRRQLFYAGKHYGALYAMLPAPGSLNDWSFTLSTIGNLSDLSLVARFDLSVKVLTFMTVVWFFNAHLGRQGELRFGEKAIPEALRPAMRALSNPDDPTRPIPTQLFQVGIWLSVDL